MADNPELTDRQKENLRQYQVDSVKAMISTSPIDQSAIPAAVEFLQEITKTKDVGVEYATGPQDAWNKVKKACGVTGKMRYIAPGFLGNQHAYLFLWAELCERDYGCDFSHTKYRELMPIAMPLHHVYCCTNLFVFCERPIRIVRAGASSIRGVIEGVSPEADYTHHCEDGPTLEYADGVKTWHINGVRVDEQIVLSPETQTVKQIDGDKENDRRMVRIQRFGWQRYLKESKAKVMDECENAVEGTYEVMFGTKHDYNVFMAVDPASDIVSLPVPNTVKDCLAAREWFKGGYKMNVIGRV